MRRLILRFAKKAEQYFILAGGLAFVIGLYTNSPYYRKSPVRIEPLNPFVIVDYSKYLSMVKTMGPDDKYLHLMASHGLPVNLGDKTHILVYRLPWYPESMNSDFHRNEDRLVQISTQNANEHMSRMILQQQKGWLGYDDNDTRRQDLGRSWRSNDPTSWLSEIKRDPGHVLMTYMNIPGKPRNFEANILKLDPFYSMIETLTLQEKVPLYGSLHASATFVSPFVIKNHSSIAFSDVKLSIRLFGQQLIDEFLVGSEIIKAEKVGDVQRLRIASIQPAEEKLIIAFSDEEALRKENIFLEERPLVDQVADHILFILLMPSIVFLL